MGGDGTLAGCEFNRAISNVVTMPIIEPGGASTLEHFYDGVARTYF
jgi:imidazole glycerol phosphate synthase subunit HisF